MQRKLEKRKTRDLKPNPYQVRKPRTDWEKRTLGQSVMKHQEVPLIIRPDGTILDGDGRWSGVMLIDPEFELECIVTDEPLDASEVQLVTAMQKNLEAIEKFRAMKQWFDAHPGATGAALATRLGVDAATVSNVMSLDRCIPAVREAAEAGLLGLTDWTACSRLDERGQHELLERKRTGGATAKEMLSAARKARNGHQPVVRVSRIKIELGRVTVTFSGKDISLDDAIDAAPEAAKVMKKGQEQGLTAKTISKMASERAKAGG